MLLTIFVVLYVFNSIIVFKFFEISVNGYWLFLLYVKTYAKGCLLVCFFWVLSSSNGIFSANSNPLFISIEGYPIWWMVTCNYSRWVCQWFLFVMCRSYMLGCKGWIFCCFWRGGSWNEGIVDCQWIWGKCLW